MGIKVVVLGDISVGKTSILNRYIRGRFEEYSETTVGAAFSNKKIKMNNGKEFLLEMWDTAGQERYSALLPMYYRGAHVVIFVFNLNDVTSFKGIKDKWISIIKNIELNPTIVLVGNKCDLVHKVNDNEINKLLDQNNNILFQKVSAKKNIGIDKLFEKIINDVLHKRTLIQPFEQSDTVSLLDNKDRPCYYNHNYCC
jgi:small GTP-binding protein